MLRAVEKHCTDNVTIVTTNIKFNDAFTSLEDKIAAILDATTNQELKRDGVSTSKKTRKITLCKSGKKMADILFAFAEDNEDEELQAKVRFSFSELKAEKDDKLVPVVKNIYDLAASNLADLKDYGVDATTLASLKTAMDNYSASVPSVKTALSERQTMGKSLKQLFKDTDVILKKKMDKIVHVFDDANPDFVSTYFFVRNIIDSGFQKKKNGCSCKRRAGSEGCLTHQHLKKYVIKAGTSIPAFFVIGYYSKLYL